MTTDYRLPATDYRLPTTRGGQQLCHCPPGHRVFPVSRDFGQWRQHERPVAKTRVRHDEIGFIHDQVAVQDQIEIEGTRRARVRAFAAEAPLDVV